MSKKIKIYHGTSEESYKSILENGFNSSLVDSMTWTCSDDMYTYCYNPQEFINHGESEDIESAQNMSIERAFENAKISAAIQKSQGKYVYVFELEVNKKDVSEDDSCNNMELACKIDSSKLSPESIVKVYRASFASNMSLVYICGLKDSDFINLDDFSDFELNMMDVLNKANIYIEDLYVDWEEVN